MRDAHPYVPNAADGIRASMLAALGLDRIDELYAAVPSPLRLDAPLDLPAALLSEVQLERRLQSLLGRNRTVPLHRVFAGGGCWPHHVPAVCDAIAGRAELLTSYWAGPATDRGKYQAYFEYASLLGEVLELDCVSLPSYDWANAAATALRMAARMTGRDEVVLAGALGRQRREVIAALCAPQLTVVEVSCAPGTGVVDLAALRERIGRRTAAVYLECPSFLGVVETGGPDACALAHEAGALAVVGVDPLSLGVLASPATYGADLVCGDLQPLGNHMQYGGGCGGFLASTDDAAFVQQFPTFLIGLSGERDGVLGYGLVAWDRTSYAQREHGRDFGGTTTANTAIQAAVYLALLGPHGLAELGRTLVDRAAYAAERLGAVPGLRAPVLAGTPFKEVVVDARGVGLPVAELNRRLLDLGFVGGLDLGREAPGAGLDDHLLVCVTEVHDADDIEALAVAIERAAR